MAIGDRRTVHRDLRYAYSEILKHPRVAVTRHDNSKIVIRKHESIQLPNLLMRNDNLPDCLKECTRNSSAPPVNGVVLNFD